MTPTLDRIFKIEMLLEGIMVQRDTPPIILETMIRSKDLKKYPRHNWLPGLIALRALLIPLSLKIT
jgi:hypothetical protein